MSTWVVTTQRETSQLVGAGQFQDGVEVSFRTGMGNTGSVFVPHSQYAPEAVKAAIQTRAEALDAVSGLTSDS